MAKTGLDLQNPCSFFLNGTNLVLCHFRGRKSYIQNDKSEKVPGRGNNAPNLEGLGEKQNVF